ncbi:Paralemmin-2 [Oryzias melastigma]|uniref:Paralemmin-2 n=1 Tax=Oryzias melastigma TaxID=30732 RepID=A0A834BX27_ORYME|nr:Paralemmin-2 [Oryzias melastigma]
MDPVNGCATRYSSHSRRHHITKHDGSGKMSRDSDKLSCKEQECILGDAAIHRKSSWLKDSSSQTCSGSEDNCADQHKTLTETLTLADSHSVDDSLENHRLHGVGMMYLKEFVLIDDDEDGDMSLREKTVTDLSATDGKAAELVCGRLLSTSSGSLSECKDESSAREAPQLKEEEPVHRDKHCCFCILL